MIIIINNNNINHSIFHIKLKKIKIKIKKSNSKILAKNKRMIKSLTKEIINYY